MAKPTIVDEVIANLKVAMAATDKQRTREKDDLRFQVPDLQWDDDVKQARAAQTVNGVPIPARPMLSVSSLDEPIQLVLNQEKAAHVGVNIHPETEDATDETAAVLEGLYRYAEVDSGATIARSWAYERGVKAGRGCYRILKEYDTSTGVPGDQKLVFKRVLYQDAWYFDPFAEQPDWSDGEWAIGLSDMAWTQYARRFGETKLARYDDSDLIALGERQPGWIGGDGPESRSVRVAEYFKIEHDPVSVSVTLPNGDTKTYEDDQRRVTWHLVNAIEELAKEDWDGQYIPVIPVIGRELQPFDGERRWVGMIGPAKDGVKLTNFAASSAVEMAALEPKAPWLMEEGQAEGHESEFQQANVRNWPMLQYRRVGLSGQPAPPPSRVQVDVARLGPSMELLRIGRDFVQSATA